jgi:predicted RNA-binding protein with PIN domain
MPYWFDGNNLIGHSAAALRDHPQVRKSFLETLSAYYKSGGGLFLVYFDGDDRGESMPPTGVRIRYSAPDSADDAIVRRLREMRLPGEVIVVSNDRSLQSRCRGAGSKVMNWQQFSSSMQARKTRGKKKKNTDEPVDVQDWARYFGLDDKDIE